MSKKPKSASTKTTTVSPDKKDIVIVKKTKARTKGSLNIFLLNLERTTDQEPCEMYVPAENMLDAVSFVTEKIQGYTIVNVHTMTNSPSSEYLHRTF
jgi:hypothetical protein